MPNEIDVISRREFTQLWTLFLALFTASGAKALASAISSEPTDNTSFWTHRIADDVPERWKLIEKAFADQWEYENRPNAWNHEDGLLAAILDSTWRHEKPPELEGYEVTALDRKIVATVIQWLGTNCGRGFLECVSERAGCRAYPFQAAYDKLYAKDHQQWVAERQEERRQKLAKETAEVLEYRAKQKRGDYDY